MDSTQVIDLRDTFVFERDHWAVARSKILSEGTIGSSATLQVYIRDLSKENPFASLKEGDLITILNINPFAELTGEELIVQGYVENADPDFDPLNQRLGYGVHLAVRDYRVRTYLTYLEVYDPGSQWKD